MNNVIATLVAVVVTLLLIVVAVVIGEQLFTGANAQKAVSEIHALNQAARSLLVGQNSWASQDLTAALASSGLAPADMISGSSLYDPWGGQVVVTINTGCGGTIPQCVVVYVNNVPNSDCAQVVTSLPVPCGSSGLAVNSATACGSTITPAWAAAKCTNNSNQVQVFFSDNN